MKRNKKFWIQFFGVAVAVVVLVWFGPKWYPNYRQLLVRSESHQIFGSITAIDGNTIKVRGVYVVENNPAKSNYSDQRDISVTVDSNTKFIKLVEARPGVGVFSDLKTGLSIIIKTASNVLNNPVVTASQIEYSAAGN